MDKFENCENLGRNKFQELCSSKGIRVSFTEDKFNNLDGFFFIGDKRGAVEIKNRFSNYDSWSIEVIKYEALRKEIESGNSYYGYFAIFCKDEAWLYDYASIKEFKELNGTSIVRARKTTCSISSYVDKEVLNLPKSIASHYKKLNNTWTKC